MKRFFLFVGNLAACIVENVLTRAEEQLLCKTYSRRSELFRTNHFWCFAKVSDKIKPHNNKKEISQQSLRVVTFFYRKPFLLQFLQSPGTCSINKVIFKSGNPGVICSILISCQFTNELNHEISRKFSRIVGFGGKRFLFSPPPPLSSFFFWPSL